MPVYKEHIKRKDIKNHIFGKPISNLEIKLLLHNRILTIPDDEYILENLGLAYHYAKKYFEGKKHITTKQYILPQNIENLPLIKAILSIDKQVSEMIAIGKLLAGEIKDTRIKETGERPILRINYLTDGKPDSPIHHIKVKNGGLYLE